MRQPAPPVADQRLGEDQEPSGDAGMVHDRADEDEEGHGQQREAVGGGDQPLDVDAHGRAAALEEEGERGHRHGEGDGQVDGEEDEQDEERQEVQASDSRIQRLRTSRTACRTPIERKPRVAAR